MASAAKTTKSRSYRTIGTTYDGVKVLAPKAKSAKFTTAQVKKAIARALSEVGVVPAKPLSKSDAPRVLPRKDGRFAVERVGRTRASAVKDTQGEAIARARELEPGTAPIVKRVRKSPGGKKGTYRKP